MDFEFIRQRIDSIIPLNRLLGIEIVALADGIAQVRLPFRKDIANHFGLVHATAIFGAAEAASGCAVAGAFAGEITRVRPVAVSATVRFHKFLRSALVADASLTEPPSALRDRFAGADSIEIAVAVAVRGETGVDIADASVAWHVFRRR